MAWAGGVELESRGIDLDVGSYPPSSIAIKDVMGINVSIGDDCPRTGEPTTVQIR
jgi:hypothetical protein